MSQYILITGCSTGIGYHLAKRLQENGYSVLATARNEKDVESLILEGLQAHQLDLIDEASIEKAAEWALSISNGKIFSLINNGAYGQTGALEDLPTTALKAQFQTNFFGWHHLTRLILPCMIHQHEGRIIQISSILGIVAMKYRGAYNASKFAVEGYSDTLRLELRGTNVHVSLIEPGPIRSAFRANALLKFKEFIQVEKSRHQAVYQQTLQRLSNPQPKNPFTLEPEACYEAVIHALKSSKPKIRYSVTFPTKLFAVLKRVLPFRWLDFLASRSA